MRYFILEHPTKGVLMDLEETEGGRTGRFSITKSRTEAMRFPTALAAHRSRLRLPTNVAMGTDVRCSEGDGTYNGAWPKVEL